MTDEEFYEEVAGISNDYQIAKRRSTSKTAGLLDQMAHRCMAELKELLDGRQSRDPGDPEAKLSAISAVLDDFEQNLDPAEVIIANIRRVIRA